MRVNYRHKCSRRGWNACIVWARGARHAHWRPWNWNIQWRGCTGSQYRWHGRWRSKRLWVMEGRYLRSLAGTLPRRIRSLTCMTLHLLLLHWYSPRPAESQPPMLPRIGLSTWPLQFVCWCSPLLHCLSLRSCAQGDDDTMQQQIEVMNMSSTERI